MGRTVAEERVWVAGTGVSSGTGRSGERSWAGMMFYFTIGIEEMLEDNIDVIIDVVGIIIGQGINILCLVGCDDLLPQGRLKRKEQFEVQNQLFVLCFHCIDNEWSSFRWNKESMKPRLTLVPPPRSLKTV